MTLIELAEKTKKYYLKVVNYSNENPWENMDKFLHIAQERAGKAKRYIKKIKKGEDVTELPGFGNFKRSGRR